MPFPKSRRDLHDPDKAADPVETWMRLTIDWDAAYAHLKAVRETRLKAEELINAPRPDMRAAEDEALERLHSLKQKMNDLVGYVGRSRPTVGDSLIVGAYAPEKSGAHDETDFGEAGRRGAEHRRK